MITPRSIAATVTWPRLPSSAAEQGPLTEDGNGVAFRLCTNRARRQLPCAQALQLIRSLTCALAQGIASAGFPWDAVSFGSAKRHYVSNAEGKATG